MIKRKIESPNAKADQDLVHLLESACRAGKLDQLLPVILSHREYQSLVTRLQIIRLLQRGLSHHDIARQLGIGVGTVTRGSHVLKHADLFTEKP